MVQEERFLSCRHYRRESKVSRETSGKKRWLVRERLGCLKSPRPSETPHISWGLSLLYVPIYQDPRSIPSNLPPSILLRPLIRAWPSSAENTDPNGGILHQQHILPLLLIFPRLPSSHCSAFNSLESFRNLCTISSPIESLPNLSSPYIMSSAPFFSHQQLIFLATITYLVPLRSSAPPHPNQPFHALLRLRREET